MKHMNVALFVPHLGCEHRCVFCDQWAISGSAKELTVDEITAACETAKKTPHERSGSEIAFFGGSFTAIDRSLMLSYLAAAKPYIDNGTFGGVRVSTRPDCIDEEVLGVLKDYGVTSVELGAQSMDDNVLKMNERGHTAADTVRACALIGQAGIGLGLQMMTGLYGSDDSADIATAEAFAGLAPDTVRIYPTIVIDGTELARLYREGKYIPPSLDRAVELGAKLIPLFETAGIRIIRLGLHSGGGVGGSYVAGPYHPAFRELCESRIMLGRTLDLLRERPKGSYIVSVPARDISKAVGQHRSNVSVLREKGWDCRFEAVETMTGADISVRAAG